MTNLELDDGTDYYTLLGVTRSASPDTVKAAYHRALLRIHPDKQRQSADNPSPRKAPRPAQVVSLEDFDFSDSEGPDGTVSIWSLTCRCGGMYKVTEDDLERGRHLIGCENCSEVVWVGYEMVEEVSGEGTG
ncbi:hypothetical protein EDB85DRAFT_1886540 [Lactarius pseudohatsudake]|nr:hypothetical protein EDB85DRAFT_1886540 [Lactarius pseudohatsudake]